MSVHYANPVIFEECHATYILNDAHIDIPNLEL